MSSSAPAAQPAAAAASPQLDGNAAYAKALTGDTSTKIHSNVHLTKFVNVVQQLSTEHLVECVNDCNALIQGLLNSQEAGGGITGQNAELLADVLIQLDVLRSGLPSAGSSTGANLDIGLKPAKFDQAKLRNQLTSHFTKAAQQEKTSATATAAATQSSAPSQSKKKNETGVHSNPPAEQVETESSVADLLRQSRQLNAELNSLHERLGIESSGEPA